MKIQTVLVLLCLLSVALGCLPKWPRFDFMKNEEEGEYNPKSHPGSTHVNADEEFYDLEGLKALCDAFHAHIYKKHNKHN